MVGYELLWREESARLAVVSPGWAVWLRSIQCLVFLLNLVLPVSFLEDEGLAFRILGDKRGNRPQGAQQPIHMNSLNS